MDTIADHIQTIVIVATAVLVAATAIIIAGFNAYQKVIKAWRDMRQELALNTAHSETAAAGAATVQQLQACQLELDMLRRRQADLDNLICSACRDRLRQLQDRRKARAGGSSD